MRKLLMLVLVSIIVTGLSFAVSITVNSPNGGEVWKRGVSKTISWNGSGLTNPVKITLWKNGVFVGLIVKNQPASGIYSWTVGAYTGGTAACATDYRIKIREQGGPSFTTVDISNSNFKIDDCRNTNRFRTSAFNVPSNPKAKLKPNRPDLKALYFSDDYNQFVRKSNGNIEVNHVFKFYLTNEGNITAVFPPRSDVFKIQIEHLNYFKYSQTSKFTIKPGETKSFLIPVKITERVQFGGYMHIYVDPSNIINEQNEKNNQVWGNIKFKRPDLKLLSISGRPTSALFKYRTRLIVKVKNIGTLSAGDYNNPVVVKSIGPPHINETYNKPIHPGKTHQFIWHLKRSFKGTLQIKVDPGNKIRESNETNNKLRYTIR